MVERGAGIGDRQEVGIAVVGIARPAQMIGYRSRIVARTKRSELVEFVLVQALGGPDRQPDAVEAERIALRYRRQPAMRWPTIDEIVLRMHLHPSGQRNTRLGFQNVTIMGRFQPYADKGGKHELKGYLICRSGAGGSEHRQRRYRCISRAGSASWHP